MAIEYEIFTPLDRRQLKRRLAEAAADAGACWVHASAMDLDPFDLGILADYGFTGQFRSYAYVRHDKGLSVEARRKLQVFFQQLPEPKVALLGYEMIDQDEFRRIPPEGNE